MLNLSTNQVEKLFLFPVQRFKGKCGSLSARNGIVSSQVFVHLSLCKIKLGKRKVCQKISKTLVYQKENQAERP